MPILLKQPLMMNVRAQSSLLLSLKLALLHPEVWLRHSTWSAFQICGFVGLVLSVLLGASLVICLELSLLVSLILSVLIILTFFIFAILIKLLTGEERFVLYQYSIVVMAIAAFTLWQLHQPILLYLDVIILCLGICLAIGRIGCLIVGCCHGRPSRWGICYGEDHAAEGFTPYLVGVNPSAA